MGGRDHPSTHPSNQPHPALPLPTPRSVSQPASQPASCQSNLGQASEGQGCAMYGQGSLAVCTLQWQRQRSIVRGSKSSSGERGCGGVWVWPPGLVCCALCGLSGSISSKEVVCPFLPLPNPFLSFPFLHHLVHCHRRRQVHIRSFPYCTYAALLLIPRDWTLSPPPSLPSLLGLGFILSVEFPSFHFPLCVLGPSAPREFLTTTLRHDKQNQCEPGDFQTVITSDPDSHPDRLGHSSQR